MSRDLHLVDCNIFMNMRVFINGKDEYKYMNIKNFPTDGIYNLTTKILSRMNPNDTYIFFFDRQTDRKNYYPSYKSNRKLRYDVWKASEVMETELKNLGLNVVAVDGYEADDLIFSAVYKYKDNYKNVFIHSTDLDLGINVDEKVSIISPNKRVKNITKSSLANMKANTGMNIKFNSIGLYKTFIGDGSDKIPNAGLYTNENITLLYDWIEGLGYTGMNMSHYSVVKYAIDCLEYQGIDTQIINQLRINQYLVYPRYYADLDVNEDAKLDIDAFETFLNKFRMKKICTSMGLHYSTEHVERDTIIAYANEIKASFANKGLDICGKPLKAETEVNKQQINDKNIRTETHINKQQKPNKKQTYAEIEFL